MCQLCRKNPCHISCPNSDYETVYSCPVCEIKSLDADSKVYFALDNEPIGCEKCIQKETAVGHSICPACEKQIRSGDDIYLESEEPIGCEHCVQIREARDIQ